MARAMGLLLQIFIFAITIPKQTHFATLIYVIDAISAQFLRNDQI